MLYERATALRYIAGGVKDEKKMILLLENDIWPWVRGGSRSQGSNSACSNFCFEYYLACGLRRPESMVRLRKEGITPFHVGYIQQEEGGDEHRVARLVALRNKHYGKPEGNRRLERIVDVSWNLATDCLPKGPDGFGDQKKLGYLDKFYGK
jgi:hypothetical protein